MQASDDWNMIRLAALVFLNARHTSLRGVLWTWAPFILLAVPCAIFGRLVFLYVWLAGGGALMLWFAIYSYCLQGRRSVACGSGA